MRSQLHCLSGSGWIGAGLGCVCTLLGTVHQTDVHLLPISWLFHGRGAASLCEELLWVGSSPRGSPQGEQSFASNSGSSAGEIVRTREAETGRRHWLHPTDSGVGVYVPRPRTDSRGAERVSQEGSGM